MLIIKYYLGAFNNIFHKAHSCFLNADYDGDLELILSFDNYINIFPLIFDEVETTMAQNE